MTTLRLVLGDQLNPCHSWFAAPDPDVLHVMMEIREETDYVLHHAQKIIAIFAAMREFARALRSAGHRVHYLAIDGAGNQQSLCANLDALLAQHRVARFEYQAPDEWRLDRRLADYAAGLPIPARMVDSEHFLGARGEAVIATKVNIPPAQRESLSAVELKAAFIRTFEGSLRRLRTDHVEILHIHDISRVEDLGKPGFVEALAELKEQKKARFVGFSTHTNMAACLDAAAASGFFDVVLVAYNYAMQDDAALRRSLEAAAAKGIGLVAMKTQCMQSWYKEGLSADEQTFYEGGIVQTAVLKWALRNDFIACAVPGFTSFRELEEDAAVARDLEYSEAERGFLADRKIKLAMAHCVQCGACRPTCPAGVDTPTLIRAHMYLRYPNVFQAREALAGLAPGKGLDGCVSCAACAARCRGRVDIAKRVGQLKLHFA